MLASVGKVDGLGLRATAVTYYAARSRLSSTLHVQNTGDWRHNVELIKTENCFCLEGMTNFYCGHRTVLGQRWLSEIEN